LFGGCINSPDSLKGVIPVLVFPVCWSVGLDNKLYKLHGTYIKIVRTECWSKLQLRYGNLNIFTKGEVVTVHAVKTHIRVKISVHPFLTSALVTMSEELHAPTALPNRKARPVPLNKQLVSPHSLSGCSREYILHLPGIDAQFLRRRQARSPVTTPTTLSGFLAKYYLGNKIKEDYIDEACGTYGGRTDIHTVFSWGNPKVYKTYA